MVANQIVVNLVNKTIEAEREKSIPCNESNATKLPSVTPILAGKNVNAPETRDVKYICVVNTINLPILFLPNIFLV